MLLLDMQPEFICQGGDEKKLFPGAQSQIAAINTVLGAGRELGLGIFVAEFVESGPTVSGVEHITANSNLAAIHPDTSSDHIYGNSAPGRFRSDVGVVYKMNTDAFDGSRLEELLKERSVGTVVVMGVNASCCVWGTVMSANERGFKVATSFDLIADYVTPPNSNLKTFYSSETRLMEGRAKVISYLRKNAPVPVQN